VPLSQIGGLVKKLSTAFRKMSYFGLSRSPLGDILKLLRYRKGH
jgi:hypothetical protein